jgi:Bacterial regulatory proteins, tetR family
MRKRSTKLPQERNSAVTRRKLVEAAIEILSREGLDAATTGHIAQSAGLKEATFYLHFGGRDEILEAAAAENRSPDDPETGKSPGALRLVGPGRVAPKHLRGREVQRDRRR